MTDHRREGVATERSTLRVLILEDDPDDAELQARALVAEGFVTEVRVVDGREAFTEQLDGFEPDLILSDYSIPGWSGEDALRLARGHSPKVPFIIVSGMVGEDRAVDLLKKGAWDYVLKDRPARLGPAVRRALDEVVESVALESLAQERQEAERALQIAESELRTTLETLLDAVVVLAAVRDPEGVIVDFQCTYANPAAVALEGATDGTLLDRRLLDLDVATASDGTLARWIRVVETGEAVAFESARPGSIVEDLRRAGREAR